MHFDQMLVICAQMRQQLKSISGGASDLQSLEDVLESEGSDHHPAEQLNQQSAEQLYQQQQSLRRLRSGLHRGRSLEGQEVFRTASHQRRVRRYERAYHAASTVVPWAPLITVFILALLSGFAVRLLLPVQQHDAAAVLRAAGAAASGSTVHRRRLNTLVSPPFRINPLAGQLPAPRGGQQDGQTAAPFFPVDTDGVAKHGTGAPAARGSSLGSDTRSSDANGGAVAGVLAPALEAANLGRRLAPGPGPRPAPSEADTAAAEVAIAAVAAPVAAAPARLPVRGEDGELLPLAAPLRVCLLTADFQGLPNAGPIATAYTLLAAALGTDTSLKVSLLHLHTLPLAHLSKLPQCERSLSSHQWRHCSKLQRVRKLLQRLILPRLTRAGCYQVTLLGVSKDLEACGRMATTQHQLNSAVQYTCLQQSHFLPATVNTQPFEQLSHAVLNWLTDHQHDCDIVQARHLSPHLIPSQTTPFLKPPVADSDAHIPCM